jgi:hypothetical protein
MPTCIVTIADGDSTIVLEANSRANAFTPHPCTDSDCDKNGCGFNPYSQGYKNYYGPGGTVDTKKPFTVVTQFNTNDGTATGKLTSITRKYLQNGVVVASANTGGDTLTSEMCNSLDSGIAAFGGLATSGEALARGSKYSPITNPLLLPLSRNTYSPLTSPHPSPHLQLTPHKWSSPSPSGTTQPAT